MGARSRKLEGRKEGKSVLFRELIEAGSAEGCCVQVGVPGRARCPALNRTSHKGNAPFPGSINYCCTVLQGPTYPVSTRICISVCWNFLLPVQGFTLGRVTVLSLSLCQAKLWLRDWHNLGTTTSMNTTTRNS
eukprot:3020508-Rhodomonas_salina.2